MASWDDVRRIALALPETTAHFDGYPAVLVRLDRIDLPELTEVVTEAWYARAPKRLAAEQRRRASP